MEKTRILNRYIFPLIILIPIIILLFLRFSNYEVLNSLAVILTFRIYLAIATTAYYVSAEFKNYKKNTFIAIAIAIATFLFWFVSLFVLAIIMYRVYRNSSKESYKGQE